MILPPDSGAGAGAAEAELSFVDAQGAHGGDGAIQCQRRSTLALPTSNAGGLDRLYANRLLALDPVLLLTVLRHS
jgi:hypothetical protein